MTKSEARALYDEYDAACIEYRTLIEMDARVMRSQDRKRLDYLAVWLPARKVAQLNVGRALAFDECEVA